MHHHTCISVSGMSICNLHFADEIDLIAGTNGELQDLANRQHMCNGDQLGSHPHQRWHIHIRIMIATAAMARTGQGLVQLSHQVYYEV